MANHLLTTQGMSTAADLFRSEAMERFQVSPWQPPLLSKPLSTPLAALFALTAAGAVALFGVFFDFARKAKVPGVLVPATGWSHVSTAVSGVLEQRFVDAGDRVRAGDVLLELVPGDGIGPSQTVEQRLLEQIGQARETLEERLRLIDERLSVDSALLTSENEADLQKLQYLEEEIERGRFQLATASRRHANAQGLAAAGSLAKDDVLTLADEVSARAQMVSEKLREADQLRSDIATSDIRLTRLRLDAQRQRLAVKEQIAQVAMDESRLSAKEKTRVLAPRDGIVASVRVNVGDRLQAGARLLDIVPEDGALHAHLFVHSSAMAGVRTGLDVRVYLDAFPYERYGAQIGTIIEVSETSVPAPETGGIPKVGMPTFRVEVGFPNGFDLASTQRAALRAGMTLSADLVTDRGTLLDWLLEPLRGASYRL